MSEKHVGTGVFDETAARWLTRVTEDRPLASGEYALTADGRYSFSPEDKGHMLRLTYDLVGPKVTLMGNSRRRRVR